MLWGFLFGAGECEHRIGLCVTGTGEEERRRFFLVFSSDDYGVCG